MMLDPAVLTAPVLDHRALDLAAARRVRYLLEQTFRYEYDEPVESLRQRLVIVPPPRHGNQHRRVHRLDVTGAQVRRRVRPDTNGNVVAVLHADRVPHSIEFRLTAVIERLSDDGPTLLPAEALHNPRLLRPTPLTMPDARLRALARQITADCANATPEETATHIGDTVSRSLNYAAGVTAVTTTAAEALALGRGVCQDYAHVMLALCHLLAIPARYVSGHLLGQGGTHAWVEVLIPRHSHAEALAFDPCNARRTTPAYLTIATGRDYSDIPPTSGTYTGTSPNRLTTTRRAAILTAA